MSVTDDLLKNNEDYAAQFSGPLPLPPSKQIAVVACMDARIDVFRVLGLQEGEAHVIRNAGGVITEDEIRSLAISQRLLGTKEIVLIHHTDCGMLGEFNWSSQHPLILEVFNDGDIGLEQDDQRCVEGLASAVACGSGVAAPDAFAWAA